VLTVASTTSTGSGAGGSLQAAARARVIEGNLALLYRPHPLCTPGEWLAEQFLGRGFLHDQESPCRADSLGLRTPPAALGIGTLRRQDGTVLLQAQLSGRELPIPLLTVTREDALLNGTTPEGLAQRWSRLLERDLRYARRMLTPAELGARWWRVALMELALTGVLVGVLALWRHSRRRVGGTPGELGSRLLLAAALAVLAAMAGIGAFAVPGEVPLALDLLLQPVGVLMKLAVVGLLAALVRGLGRLLLSQWAGRGDVPEEHRARRDQRHRSLHLMTRRLIDLAAVLVVTAWVLADIPGVRELSTHAVLASGALLGALAIVFQGLLRDFVAGLVVLLDDRYAIGDSVELGGLAGEVVDLGVLSTELRGTDQRVITVPNSRCEPVVNHTKLRSGAELTFPLAAAGLDLPRALAAIGEEARAFAADPGWQPRLLKPPVLRGVSAVSVNGVTVSLVITTIAGQQGAAKRALLGRIVERLGREGIALASSSG
jgi:small conductance mechanosensitive channel